MPLLELATALAVGAAPAPPPCHRAGERVVAVSPVGAVVRRGSDLLGCDRRTGRRVILFRHPMPAPNEIVGTGDVTLRGTAVAFSVGFLCTVCGSPGDDTLRAGDVRGGPLRALRRIHDPLPHDAGARVRAVALNACGAIAFVSAARWSLFTRRDADRELRLWRPGSVEVLDRGGIELASLRVSGTAVLWRRGGAWRRHVLPVTCSG